jgi:hypothetical protein
MVATMFPIALVDTMLTAHSAPAAPPAPYPTANATAPAPAPVAPSSYSAAPAPASTSPIQQGAASTFTASGAALAGIVALVAFLF